jgi:hypothetical protein
MTVGILEVVLMMVGILEVDILLVGILEVILMTVGILEVVLMMVGILEVNILLVGILEVDILPKHQKVATLLSPFPPFRQIWLKNIAKKVSKKQEQIEKRILRTTHVLFVDG